jgi:hypothetical protein
MAVDQVVVGAISIQGKSQSNIVKGGNPMMENIYSYRKINKYLQRTHVLTIDDNNWNICQQNAQSKPVVCSVSSMEIFYI